MSEEELDAAVNGQPLTAEQRAWCLEQHQSLREYTHLEDPANSSDQELARDVQLGSWAYVRCAMNF